MKIPQSPPSAADILAELGDDTDRLRRLIMVQGHPLDPRGRYLHWDDMRSRTPPDGLTRSEWWFTTARARKVLARSLPLLSADGRPFNFCNVDVIQEAVHVIDKKASGEILAADVVTNLHASDRFLVSSLIEEAITSSQLEGASTTRRVAKAMLESGRPPRNTGERMIFNNYQAMIAAQGLRDDPLTPDDVLSLHRILTEDTLERPDAAGRIQSPEDDRIGVYWHDDTLLHRPPPAEQLPNRLEEMCRFANEETPDGFLHPVARAIILHFWLAYDHPFVDGNGRTARALFYWCMLHNGYWLTEYLSISSILRRSPAKYARSYLYTETDNYDVTYFVLHQLDVIDRAIKGLHEYLRRKIAEDREIDGLIRGSDLLNHRQLPIMHAALRDPHEPFTIAAQARRNRVTYQTARTDLLGLEELGLLVREVRTRKFIFRSPPDLARRLRALGDAAEA